MAPPDRQDGSSTAAPRKVPALELCFASTYDPLDVRAWSGTVHFMAKAFRDQGVGLDVVAPLLRNRLLFRKALNRMRSMAMPGTFLPAERTLSMARRFAEQIGDRFRRGNGTVVFSPGSIPVALLDPSIPHAFFADATFAGLLDEYPELEGYDEAAIAEGHELEEQALKGSSRVFYTSQWAARSAVERYGADPSRIRVLPFGPNLGRLPDRDEVIRAVERRGMDRCELLFVGVTWERKGGPFAAEVAGLLNDRGIPTRLTVVGCTPPAPWSEHVQVVPFIAKDTVEGQLRLIRMMLDAHFLIMPSRAECFGIVYAEASAMGLPSLARDTGGVAEAVHDGANGRLFSAEATPVEYADAVEELLGDREAYRALAERSRLEHETRLNWPATVRAMREELMALH